MDRTKLKDIIGTKQELYIKTFSPKKVFEYVKSHKGTSSAKNYQIICKYDEDKDYRPIRYFNVENNRITKSTFHDYDNNYIGNITSLQTSIVSIPDTELDKFIILMPISKFIKFLKTLEPY